MLFITKSGALESTFKLPTLGAPLVNQSVKSPGVLTFAVALVALVVLADTALGFLAFVLLAHDFNLTL